LRLALLLHWSALVAYDVFTPPREDWINGDDAYLRAK
jgi:hypothetical protein